MFFKKKCQVDDLKFVFLQFFVLGVELEVEESICIEYDRGSDK